MKNKIYHTLALALILGSLVGMKALADDRKPVLAYNGYELKSEGNIVYQTKESKGPVTFHSGDLYRIADRINELREKIR